MKKQKPLLAGSAILDITPPLGTQLSGAIGQKRSASGILDRLHARALILRQGKTTLCILCLDLAMTRDVYTTPLRRKIAGLLKTTPASVLIHAMQSHSAPSLGRDENPFFPREPDWLRGTPKAYITKTIPSCIRLVQSALARLEPVSIEAGRSNDGRLAFNRRFMGRNGRTQTHAGIDDPNVAYCEGPADPEVSVTLFRNTRNKVVASILHHTCHPTHGWGGTAIGADWPGHWATAVEKQFGKPCVALVINGALGNIHHRDHMNRRHADTTEGMTACLMETTDIILKQKLKPISATHLAATVKKVPLALRRFPDALLKKERAILRRHPQPLWSPDGTVDIDWMFAAWDIHHDNCRRKNPTHTYEIQVFRIGDIALVGWPDEPFVEAQLALKIKPATDLIIVAHHANHGWSYMPPRQAYINGGYEVRYCFYAPGSMEKVQRTTRALLHRQFVSN